MNKEKSFDAVAFMRSRREEIDQEDAGLSWTEKREKTRGIVEKDPLWRSLQDRLANKPGQSNTVVREDTPKYGSSDN